MVKPSSAQKMLAIVSNDLFDLVLQFKGQAEVTTMHSYKQLERILNEQCNVEPTDGGSSVQVKAPKEIPSSSRQNPSDPDASYSGHKGQGYQVQIMETYAATEDKEIREKTLNLITHVQVEPAHESDANALIPAVESAKESGLAPTEILVDFLCGSDENCREAKEAGVEIVSPTMGGKKGNSICLSAFESSESGKILTCPHGHAPEIIKKKKTRHTAAFDSFHCSGCPNQTKPNARSRRGRNIIIFAIRKKKCGSQSEGPMRRRTNSKTATGGGPASKPPCRNMIGEPESSSCE